MKILQVCAYAAPYEGNFIKSLKALGEALEERGHEMLYAFPETAKNIPWCQELAKQAKVYFLPLAKARIRPSTYLTLRRIYRENPTIGIVHSHFELYDVPVTWSFPGKVKIFWHLHDALEMYSDLKNRLVHKLQYGWFHGRAVLLSVSQKHMTYVLKCGFPSAKAKYLPNGLDIERINRVEKPVAERKFDFLIFGWEYERKGVDLCCRAVRELKCPVRVAVIGTAETASKIASQMGNVDGVEVIPPQADINVLYNQAKCFLHISRAEGLSYALLEVVYAGLPVICSDIPENLFADKFPSVRFVKNGDASSISAAMSEVMNSPELPETIVTASRQLIEQEYSISCWVNNMLRQYGLS